MKRTVSALVILAFLPLALVRVLAAGVPAAGAHPDSVSVLPAPPASEGIRIEDVNVRFGAGDLREPTGIAADWHGYVYVADAMAGKVFRYAPDGSSLEFERRETSAGFYPIDIAALESYILVLDYSQNALLRYDFRGAYLDVLLAFGEFNDMRPVSVSTSPNGSIVTTNLVNASVVLWTPLFDLEFVIGGFGRGEGQFNEPRKAAFLPGQRIVVVESLNRRLQFFSPSGRFERTAVPPAETPFVSPRSVCVDEQGTVFVCDAEAGSIFVFSSDGSYLTSVRAHGGRAIAPAAAAPGWDGSLYVADLKSRSVLVYRLVYPRVK